MTPTIKLRRLSLANFGPFVGSHELALPPNGLHMVLGENLDTDESSGAGKSSLVESLAYAFDYSLFASTDLKSWDWLTEEPMEVGVTFEVPGDTIAFKRGKKPILQAWQKGVTVEGSAKSVKEELTRLIGVRPEILKALTYRPQGQPGLFLAMTDQEKKSFLTELLGLQVYEVEADRVIKVISELEQQELSKKAVYDSLALQVPAEPWAPEALDTSELERQSNQMRDELLAAEETMSKLKERDQAAVDAQTAREKAVRDSHSPHLHNLQVAIAELESRPRIKPEPERPEPPPELAILKKKLEWLRNAISAAKTEHQNRLRHLRATLDEFRAAEYQLRSHAEGQKRTAASELNRLRGEVAILEKQICDRCNRAWCDGEHARVLTEKRSAITSCECVLQAAENELLDAQQAARRAKEQELTVTFEEGQDPVTYKLRDGERDYAQKVADVEATYKSDVANAEQRCRDALKVSVASFRQEVAEANASYSKAEREYIQALNEAQEMAPDHVRIRESMTTTKELLAGLYSDRRLVGERIESARTRHRDLMAQFKRESDAWNAAMERAHQAGLQHQLVLAKMDQERDYLGCVRSFLGAIFDETLNRIAHLTNERLAKVPNVQGLTLRFVSERETKTTKNLRQEIRPIVERDGHEIPLKRTSGGQYTAVELAVDLSLADVIAERTGVMPGWLVLDESFNGLPTKSKSACLELLKDAAATRLILVIDHAIEFRELFDSQITIRSQDGRSSFA